MAPRILSQAISTTKQIKLEIFQEAKNRTSLASLLATSVHPSHQNFARNDCGSSKTPILSQSHHRQICNISAPTYMDKSEQRLQVIPAERMRSVTPAAAPPTKKPGHLPSARDKGHKSEDRVSSVIGSRIQKKSTTHTNMNTASSVRATAPGVLTRVFVNNRLGTRTEVPCSPTDTIGAFKRVAAVHLGTRPEAMILKRQGERPLKDFLTLDDYEIRNGSSLDLEIDTCD